MPGNGCRRLGFGRHAKEEQLLAASRVLGAGRQESGPPLPQVTVSKPGNCSATTGDSETSLCPTGKLDLSILTRRT